jgi:hypothetical protein
VGSIIPATVLALLVLASAVVGWLATAEPGVPLRLRRTAGCGENRLPALGFGE